jgi:hypothetical protein
MALVVNDRVLETSITQGTGSITLNGPPSSYQSFNAGIGSGNTTYYAIFNTAADEWETGLGTLTSPTTLARTTVYQSSNSDNLVNFSVGTKNVFCTLPSQRSVYEDASGNIDGYPITNGTIDGAAIGSSTPDTGAFTTLSASSTVSGTGFSNYLASPPSIGSSTPASGAFTSLSASGTVSGTGFSNYLASPPAIGGATPAAGTFTSVAVTTQVIVPETTPTAAAVDTYKLFSKSLGGRQVPAFIGEYGVDCTLNPHFGTNRVALWQAIANTATSTSTGLTYTNTGTATAAAYSTATTYGRFNKVENLVTGATTSAVAGIYVTTNAFTTGAGSLYGGFNFVARFGPATGVATATSRLFCGMTNSVAAPTDVNPSTLLNMVGVGYDSADTNLQIMHNDGTGTATKIDLGSSFAVPTSDRTAYYQLALYSPPNNSDIGYTVTNLVTGAVAAGTIVSADVPAGTTTLSPRIYSSVGGTSSVIGVGITSIYVESDF